MAKQEPREASAERPAVAARATARERPAPAPARTPGPSVSEPMRLAAEVARLEAELAVMRARIAELESRAERDPLTGLLNRRGFERELARVGSYVRRYGGGAALIYLDLDGFKPVNDRYGHAAGDAVLVAVAAALVTAVRASDAVARIGGDEFAVLLWNVSASDAQKKALALEVTIAETRTEWEGGALSVGASVGLADIAQDHDAGALVARADAAMYARKRDRKANAQ
jgi:diguanylate cyclase (GGDEF)-like protein